MNYLPRSAPTAVAAAISLMLLGACATKPATPADKTTEYEAPLLAIPTSKLAIEMMPSFAPSTMARKSPMR